MLAKAARGEASEQTASVPDPLLEEERECASPSKHLLRERRASRVGLLRPPLVIREETDEQDRLTERSGNRLQLSLTQGLRFLG